MFTSVFRINGMHIIKDQILIPGSQYRSLWFNQSIPGKSVKSIHQENNYSAMNNSILLEQLNHWYLEPEESGRGGSCEPSKTHGFPMKNLMFFRACRGNYSTQHHFLNEFNTPNVQFHALRCPLVGPYQTARSRGWLTLCNELWITGSSCFVCSTTTSEVYCSYRRFPYWNHRNYSQTIYNHV